MHTQPFPPISPLQWCRRTLSPLLSYKTRQAISRLLFGSRQRTTIRSGTLAGCSIAAPLNERMAFGLGSYEPFVMTACEQYCQPGAVFYDVGAHIGFFSMLAAKKKARVFSFEANPKNLALLRENMQSNSFTEVTPVAKAVAEHEGTLQFATFGFSLVGSIASKHTPADATLLEVPCTSLDAFVFQQANIPPTLIKIDVEGAEGKVLQGAQKLLAENKPVLLIEIHSAEQQQVVKTLTEPLGYSWRRLDSGKITLSVNEVGQFIGINSF